MSSVLRSYAPRVPATVHVTLTGGNGSNAGGNVAKAFIDIRRSSTFVVDVSRLVSANSNVYVQFDTTPGAVGQMDGKLIYIVCTGFQGGVIPSFTSNLPVLPNTTIRIVESNPSIQMISVGGKLTLISPTLSSTDSTYVSLTDVSTNGFGGQTANGFLDIISSKRFVIDLSVFTVDTSPEVYVDCPPNAIQAISGESFVVEFINYPVPEDRVYLNFISNFESWSGCSSLAIYPIRPLVEITNDGTNFTAILLLPNGCD